jgi:hypothetical protein
LVVRRLVQDLRALDARGILPESDADPWPPEVEAALEELQPGCFSACTCTVSDRHVIVHSPASVGRMQADAAHEVSHIRVAAQAERRSTQSAV